MPKSEVEGKPGELRDDMASELSDSLHPSAERHTCCEINDAYKQCTGYSRREVLGKASLKLSLWSKVEDRGSVLCEDVVEEFTKIIFWRERHTA